MKKRIISLVMMLAMCFSLIPATGVMAAEEITTVFSDWAQDDLIIGDNYDIYPQSWYEKGMTAPIKQGQFRVLLAGLRKKILKTDCVIEDNNKAFTLDTDLTVEEVLNVLHSIVSSYEYTVDLELKDNDVVEFMSENGIYTGQEGELGLSDTCTIEQAIVFSIRLITYLYNALDAGSKGFLWEVTSGENTVYLLGSIHMADFSIYPFSKTVLDAYASSDALAVELNMFDAEGAMAIAELGVYTDGTTLKDHVSEETYQKTIELATLLGYPIEQIVMLKPWYIYSLFSSLVNTESGTSNEANTSVALGIDLYFMLNAYIYEKPILEVEGYEFQGKVLDSFSDELEEYLLKGTVDTLYEVIAGTYTEGVDYLDLMLEYWKDGDVEAFKKFTAPEFEYPELYEDDVTEEEKALVAEFEDKLMTQRDKGMADYVDNLLKTKEGATFFVVLGSGHFISDYSVLDILKEKGYEINRLN